MKSIKIIVVRIYLTESEHKLASLLAYLHDQSKVRGVTVFRGITGFGKSGKMHSSNLLDLSLDLPLVIEFFDEAEKIYDMLPYVQTLIEPGHLIYWPAYGL